ncbi:MAG TPA: hypothetical protein PL001_12335, partial [Candidatus Kryptobacter bacterium]|nr:hypothetical protein [Candidatus Kryptobacter bacterium]
YQQMYEGKPGYMTEDQYRTARDQRVLNEAGVQDAFSTYAGRQLSADELNKIFYGGQGSDNIRREYARVKSMKDSADAMRGNLFSTTVKATPMGPTQPLLAGRDINAGDYRDVFPHLANSPIVSGESNPVPKDNQFDAYDKYRNTATLAR